MFWLFVVERVVGVAVYLATGVYLAREIDWDLQGRWYRWPALAGITVAWPLVMVIALICILIFD